MVLNDIFVLMGLQFIPPGLCSLSTCCWVLNRHLRHYMSGRFPASLPQLWCSYSPIPPLLLSQLKATWFIQCWCQKSSSQSSFSFSYSVHLHGAGKYNHHAIASCHCLSDHYSWLHYTLPSILSATAQVNLFKKQPGGKGVQSEEQKPEDLSYRPQHTLKSWAQQYKSVITVPEWQRQDNPCNLTANPAELGTSGFN